MTDETTSEDPAIFFPSIAIAFVFVVAAFGCFALVADSVANAPSTLALDDWAHALVVPLRTPGRTSLVRALTIVGEGQSIAVITAVVSLWLWKKHSRRRLYAFLATMIGGAVVDIVLKHVFHRARPADALITLTEYSFPSGHSMGSMLLASSLAYVAWTSTRSVFKKALSVIMAALAVVLVGGTRIYLGVHYASDVLGGFLCGLGWAGACFVVTEMAAERGRRRRTSAR